MTAVDRKEQRLSHRRREEQQHGRIGCHPGRLGLATVAGGSLDGHLQLVDRVILPTV